MLPSMTPTLPSSTARAVCRAWRSGHAAGLSETMDAGYLRDDRKHDQSAGSIRPCSRGAQFHHQAAHPGLRSVAMGRPQSITGGVMPAGPSRISSTSVSRDSASALRWVGSPRMQISDGHAPTLLVSRRKSPPAPSVSPTSSPGIAACINSHERTGRGRAANSSTIFFVTRKPVSRMATWLRSRSPRIEKSSITSGVRIWAVYHSQVFSILNVGQNRRHVHLS